jgi:endogenous inhibitor of DNA gyrase (YacG/DUF329 family)
MPMFQCPKCQTVFEKINLSGTFPGGKEREDIDCPSCGETVATEVTSAVISTREVTGERKADFIARSKTMTATTIAALDHASAERQLIAMAIPAKDRQVLEATLRAIDEASDSRHLELVMAHATGLLQGLAIGLVFKHEVLAQVGELFEAVAKHERVRMVV